MIITQRAHKGRKPRSAWEHLIPLIRRLRLEGFTCKVIAQQLGYSPSYIQEICIRHDLKKQFKCKPRPQEPAVSLESCLNQLREGASGD